MLKTKSMKQTQALNSSSSLKKSSSLINILPDCIIENFMKNIWKINIKEEMFNKIKNLSFIYEKDALTKAYEFKLQYLINYRNYDKYSTIFSNFTFIFFLIL